MGEVYRARDTTLRRDVAIKTLPDAFAGDPDRLARFEREAHTLASLNHPHIAQIYGFESTNSVRALVMELVEGPTLADRIALGRIPLDEALPIARQIAEALAAAHEQGIIHRDVKPANIKLRTDGAVKVLDFGLAKLADPAGGAGPSGGMGGNEGLASPTITSPAMTRAGIILGTAAYMAPEQAKGKPADKRADIWAFGCVLYEMLTGRRAFGGDDVSETLAEVIKGQPDWTKLPPGTPSAIGRLLRRCLEKDRTRRLADISDARFEIDEAQAGASDGSGVSRGARWERLAWAAALALVSLVAIALMLAGRATPAAPEMRVEITTPPTSDAVSLALSPDGQTIAFVATASGRPHLWVRSLGSGAMRPLAGTEGASQPFWSPNSRSLGFFADGSLKRIDLDGGTVRVLADARLPRGGTWSGETILFAPRTGSIFRIAAAGGEPAEVTRLEASQSQHGFPSFLPDGRHFIYYVFGSPEARGTYLATLGAAGGRRLLDVDSVAVFAPPRHLLFVRGDTLFAQVFDASRRELAGTPYPIAEEIARGPVAGSQVAAFAVAAGRIVYRTGGTEEQRQFVWFDRSGKELAKVGDPDGNRPLSPSLSADGRRLAMHRAVDGNVDVWVLDVGRGALSRFTSHSANEIHPIWSPDGSRILYSSNRTGSYMLYEKPTMGAADDKLVQAMQAPTDWSRDGRFLLFQGVDPKTRTDIWALPLGADSKPFLVLQTEFDERDGQFSPDGKWVAYSSTESGRSEVYVQPFPGPGARVQVSINGGAQVRWRRDGKELFFIGLDDRLMAVPIALSESEEVGAPVPLFATRVGGALQPASRTQYFASPDGRRFLMNTVLPGAPVSPISLIVNWNPEAAGSRE
jgi:eukaryotic-like serine/threonine-protein kinase